MLSSVTLRNYKSFGALTTVPLEPITVLVGPNNSGKSNFLSVPGFVQQAVQDAKRAIEEAGGSEFLVHQPPDGDGSVRIGWKTDDGDYTCAFKVVAASQTTVVDEKLVSKDGERAAEAWRHASGMHPSGQQHLIYRDGKTSAPVGTFTGLGSLPAGDPGQAVWRPMKNSRLVRLSISSLRNDSPFIREPRLTTSGEGLAAVLQLWRGAMPERAAELDAFLGSCVPELKHALSKPASDTTLRLWFEEKSGYQVDAPRASDGLLVFTALAMHIIEAGDGAVIFVEEPERGIHPRRLRELVDLMRRAVCERNCQIVMATHSPVVLNAFKDEPESIVLFRRGEHGTEVKRCIDLPKVMDALDTAMPSDLLETAFFGALWPAEG